MFRRIRQSAGVGLILISLLMILIPAAFRQNQATDTFRSGNRTEWGINRVAVNEHGPVRINKAEAEELKELPGIGEILSLMIIQERSDNGPYYYAEDLISVKGIGPATLQNIREQLDMTQDESGE